MYKRIFSPSPFPFTASSRVTFSLATQTHSHCLAHAEAPASGCELPAASPVPAPVPLAAEEEEELAEPLLAMASCQAGMDALAPGLPRDMPRLKRVLWLSPLAPKLAPPGEAGAFVAGLSRALPGREEPFR